jgi:predicted RNA-binding protein YlxR (DUF448 family)
MCVGCGARAPQDAMLRLIATPNGELQVAAGRSPMGRSGYLHRSAACWERFAARKGPLRSLGCSIGKAERLALVARLKDVGGDAKVRKDGAQTRT